MKIRQLADLPVLQWLLPQTLFARLMLIWLLGIALVLAVSVTLLIGERDRFDRGVLFEGLAREVAATVDHFEQLSPAERINRIESMRGRQRLRLSLSPVPSEARRLPDRFELVSALRSALPDREIGVFAWPQRDGDHAGPQARLFVEVRLIDGSLLSMRLAIPPIAERKPGLFQPGSRPLTALFALIAGIAILTWLAVRIATRPLRQLSAAADALGQRPDRAPIPESGPSEVKHAAAAFNRMQKRVNEHVRDRTRILAAITHDLLTPITRLRLRAEQVDDDELRTRIQSDLDAMQALAREGLDYARSQDTPLTLKPVDAAALLDSLCADAQDMGWKVSRSDQTTANCLADVMSLRRVLWNLIENGVKFGGQVEISLHTLPSSIEISIRDHGPGLPESELDKVFEPFYRSEHSRNRETGGTGLGLAIAHNLLKAQGGTIQLKNAHDGGLLAQVTLTSSFPPQAG